MGCIDNLMQKMKNLKERRSSSREEPKCKVAREEIGKASTRRGAPPVISYISLAAVPETKIPSVDWGFNRSDLPLMELAAVEPFKDAARREDALRFEASREEVKVF